MNSFHRRMVGLSLVIVLVSSVDAWAAEIPWARSSAQVLERSRTTGKPVVVYVSTDWCHYCDQMNRLTWKSPRIVNLVGDRFHALALDGDQDRQLVETFGLTAYPATVLFSSDGRYLAQRSGFMTAEQLESWLLRRTAAAGITHRPTAEERR